jgi:hypothetical protein
MWIYIKNVLKKMIIDKKLFCCRASLKINSQITEKKISNVAAHAQKRPIAGQYFCRVVTPIVPNVQTPYLKMAYAIIVMPKLKMSPISNSNRQSFRQVSSNNN